MFFTVIVSFLFLLYIYCFINMSLLQAHNGMTVSPGCLVNTLSIQGLLLTMSTQYVENSWLDHTLWMGFPRGPRGKLQRYQAG